MTLRAFSYGGGVQSNAALVLAAQGRLDYGYFLFANVGGDSENPATLGYIEQHATPYAAAAGIELIELRKERRDGTRETVYSRLTKRESRSIGIPVRMSSGAPGRRECTKDFKIRVIAKWLQAHGATAEDPAALGIGFSTDELGRAGSPIDPRQPWQIKEFPLLDLHLSRQDCINVVVKAGLPQPPKSACVFCPMKSRREWKQMQRDQPEQFERVCALEELLNARRETLGKDHIYFTGAGRSLRQAFGGGVQLSMNDLLGAHGACDSGYCFL